MPTRMLGTGQLILQDVLFRGGEGNPTMSVNSDYYAEAQALVQRAYNDIWGAEPWPWALSQPPGIIQCVPAIEEVATVTVNSASVTLTGTYGSLAGFWMWLTSEYVPYRILSSTGSPTTLTLDAPYQTPTGSPGGGSGISVEIFQDEYPVATNCLRVWSIWNRTNPTAYMDLITEGEMIDRYPNRDYGVWPKKAALMRSNLLRVIPWPQINYCTLEYEYSIKLTADLTFDGTGTDIPNLPVGDNTIISDMALAMLYDLKNDSRAEDMLAVAGKKLDLMRQNYIPVGEIRSYVRPGGGLWR